MTDKHMERRRDQYPKQSPSHTPHGRPYKEENQSFTFSTCLLLKPYRGSYHKTNRAVAARKNTVL